MKLKNGLSGNDNVLTKLAKRIWRKWIKCRPSLEIQRSIPDAGNYLAMRNRPWSKAGT